MNDNVEEIRDRIARRKNKQLKNLHTDNTVIPKPSFQYGDVEFTKNEMNLVNNQPNNSSFFIRLLSAILLVSCIAIIFQLQQNPFVTIQQKISTVMEKEFQFAVVSNWYESKFGKPLTFLVPNESKVDEVEVIQTAGRVLEPFQTNGQGVLIETTSQTEVESFEEGLVIFAGNKEELGNTVIVQNIDGSETWYGKLDTISVHVYDDVKKGDTLASVITEEDGDVGTYYLAIKKDNEFIDPNQVILFE